MDCRFSRVLCRRSVRSCRRSLDHAGGRRADQFPRRSRGSARKRAVDPVRPAQHRYSCLSAVGVHRWAVRFTAILPYVTVLWLAVAIGFIVQGNFSNLTSGVLAVAAPRHRGATIGAYSCIGFGAGFLGTVLFGVTLDLFGGTSQLAAWTLSFGTCGLACLAGAAATIFLSRDVWQRRP